MIAGVADVVDALRDPEYTGENRCRPCTVVNLVLAGVVGGGLAPVSVPLGAAAFVASLGAIYLRGYLVPGTPRLTRRYLPEPVLALFGKSSAGATGLDVYPALERAGVVEGDEPTEMFRTAWLERVAGLAEGEPANELASHLDVDAEAVTLREYPDGFVASVAGSGAGRWPSRTAFLADLAAALELRSRGVDPVGDIQELAPAVGDLRRTLDRCPACGGALEAETTTAVACCGASRATALTCRDCGARVFEAEIEDDADAEGDTDASPERAT